MKDDLILQIGFKPVKIDILTSLAGLNFDDAFSKSIEGLFYGKVNAKYLDKESLIKNKQLREKKRL